MLERHRSVHKSDDALAREVSESPAHKDETLARALGRWSANKKIRGDAIAEDNAEVSQDKLDEVQRRFESLATERGVFSSARNPETGQTVTVINDAALRAVIDSLFEKERAWGKKRSKAEVMAVLPRAIGERPVLTTMQVEKGDFREKPFFYIPQNADAATDSAAIKNSSFHHFVSDFVPFVRREDIPYPVRDSAGGEISPLEVKAAALIFHPEYGDGYRNESGVLLVRAPETREYKKFSGDFLRAYGIQNKEFILPKGAQSRHAKIGARSIREGVKAELPHLVQKRLLRPVEDFKQMTHGRVNVADQRVERAGVSSSGARSIHGVLTYIGKEFKNESIRIVDISPTLGAVVNMSQGSERITHTFNIFSRDQIQPTKGGTYFAGAELTQTRPFSAETVALPRRNDETLEQYRDRTEKTDRGLAHLLLKVFPKYPGLASMLRDRPPYEQTSIAQAAYLLERDHKIDDFNSFIEKHGESGARTFLVTANDDALRDRTFEFGKSISKEDARPIFEVYGKIIDTIDGVDSYLREQFGEGSEQVAQEVTSRMFKRASDLLARSIERRESPRELAKLVESVHAANAIFLEAFKALKGGGALRLEQIRDLRFERQRATDVGKDEAMRGQIRTLCAKCHADDAEEYRNEILADTEKTFANENSYFYTLSYKGQLIGMMRFDEKRDASGDLVGMYAGGLNVDPEFGGGRIGDEIIEKTFENEKKHNVPIDAHVKTDSPLAIRYLRGDFISDKIETRRDVPRFHIILDSGNARFPTKSQEFSADDVVRHSEGGERTNHRIFAVYNSLPNEIPDGYVLSRLVPQNGKYYAAFERLPSSERFAVAA